MLASESPVSLVKSIATESAKAQSLSEISLKRSSSETSLTSAEMAMDDVRIEGYDPLIQPELLSAEYPLSLNSKKTVLKARTEAAEIIKGDDDRLLVIVGPCSIHDPAAAKEYCAKLIAEASRFEKELLVVMRTYFEKPRTTVGWKGLINDPDLVGSFKINQGLKVARSLLSEITDAGMPCAVELLDTISPQYLGDLISWGAIGARTTESQLHRELASGVSFPVGFKNGTDGRINIAIDAVKSSSHPHRFLGVNKFGLASITKTVGNDLCHIILRGGAGGPNYEREHVVKAEEQLRASNVNDRIMIDCSHGNSSKKHRNQIIVASNIAKQIAMGDASISGVMIESFIEEGRQDLKDTTQGLAGLVYGQSITDACLSWEQTVPVLSELAEAVKSRRSRNAAFH